VPLIEQAFLCLARLFLHTLLPSHRVRLTGAQPTAWQALSTPKPREGQLEL
jgi:hypothetical protein